VLKGVLSACTHERSARWWVINTPRKSNGPRGSGEKNTTKNNSKVPWGIKVVHQLNETDITAIYSAMSTRVLINIIPRREAGEQTYPKRFDERNIIFKVDIRIRWAPRAGISILGPRGSWPSDRSAWDPRFRRDFSESICHTPAAEPITFFFVFLLEFFISTERRLKMWRQKKSWRVTRRHWSH
jgi:hypothetical protein